MSYDIKSLKSKLDAMNGVKGKKGAPYQAWKPSLTEDGKPRTFNVRFLPYQDSNGHPFQTVEYYDSKALTSWRLVVPSQFGLPDPIASLVSELRKKRNDPAAWSVIKNLLPKPRYFAPILVRDEEAKGVQVWELSPTVCKDIYTIMLSEDYQDEDVTNPEKGFDFQVFVTSSGKTFTQPGTGKSYPVNDVKISARTKSSKLLAKPEDAAKLIAQIPPLADIFTKQVKPSSEIEGMLEAYLSAGSATSEIDDEEVTSHGVAESDADAASNKSVEDQFAGL